MTTIPLAGLDSRVTDQAGQPVPELRFIRWFRVTRADGPAGVILTARIPGYLDETSPHPTQDAALRAAKHIYADYREAVDALSGRSEHQEN
jgi:hypothetical protein